MKTPTLVLATILAMAVVGDSANMEKILQQLGFPTGKGPTDDVNVNHKDKAQEKDKGTKFNSKPAKPPALDTANAVDEKASKASGEKGKEYIPDITKILADKVPKVKGGTKFTSGPTQAGIPVNAITRATNKVEEKGKHPASKAPEPTHGKEVTFRSTPTPKPLTTITPVLENVETEGQEGNIDDTTMPSAEVTEETKFSPGPTQGVNSVNAITPSTENTGQEGQSTDFIPDIQGQEYGNATKAPEKAKRKKAPSGPAKPMAQASQKYKPKGAVPLSAKNYDQYDWYNYEDAGSGENDVNGDYRNEKRGLDANIFDTFLVRNGEQDTKEINNDDGGSGENYVLETEDYNNEKRGLDSTAEDPDFEEGSGDITTRGLAGQNKRQLEALIGSEGVGHLVSAATDIGVNVVNKIFDWIAGSGGESKLEKVSSGLQDYLGKQMDKFDDEYKDLLKDTSGLAAGLNRPVKEADIQLVPKPGGTMGNMYAPPGWEIRHKYKYKEDSDKDKVSSGGQAAAYTYPAGLGPVLMSGCFGTGYKNGDPCYKAKIPRTGCPNLIDGATYLGVGFDGRGVYSAESRKKSIIQRSCSNLQTYGKNEVPDCMTVQGIYDTGVESHAFNSMEEYRRYLEEKSAVTSAKAMFQEEIYKASAYSTIGNLIWAVGTGVSTQSGGSKQSSGSHASSSARGRLGEKQTQRFMAMLEINIFRYEIFMDDVKPDQLSVGFLRDFISLPQSYFSSGAEIAFQNFYLRWGTHYIKSATFGGQLKIMKTKVATKDLSMSEFATRAEADWKMTLNTFGAYASQSNIEFGYIKEAKTEIKQKNGKAAAGSASSANRYQWKQASSQEYSSEVMVVQGGDQKIAAAITEMYTTALTTELKDWLESIDDYPKPFSFVLRPVSELLNIPFDSLFPAGNVDYGCLGTRQLKTEKKTGRKYYTQETVNPDVGNTAAKNSSKTIMVSEIRYCDFADRNDLENSMTKRRLSLERAVTVYLEEGRLLSSDFLLPAGEAGCETAMLAYLQGSKSGVPTWKEMIGGNEFTVIFDMPYDIPGIIQAQDVLQLKFISRMWLSTRIGSAPHLYDGYDNGGSNDVQEKKVSVQGLVMTYTEGTGVFTVTDDDFKASVSILPDLPQWIKGRRVARAEYKKLLNHLGRKMDTMGDVPCSIQWSNAHNFNPNGKGKCIHFTAASEGDIFVVFASIPQNHETWIYIQISPEGVALYKAMRLQTTQLNDKAGGLGSATLYQSYFVCVTEDATDKTTVIQYGKMPYNEERPHVWLGFTFHEVASLRYYSFGSGESPVKVMGLSLLDKPAKDFIICREGTEMVDGVCRQKCHPECKGCRTSGSNSPTDCIACKHLKVSKDRQIGSFECVTQCPPHMQASIATKTCTCIKKMEKAHPDGVVYCVTDCPLTHFDDNNVCKKCSSFCKDINHVGNSQSNALNQTNVVGKRICSGPASTDCDTCKYQHEGRCVEECRPGQKAVKTGEHGAFTCRRCHPGHECKLGDEREDICPAGTASNDKSTKCVPCAAGEFSNSSGAASCQKCHAGKYSTAGGSTSCLDCPAGKYSSTAGSTGCTICPAGKYSSRAGSDLCETCPAGKYSEKESTVCKTCPVGKYSSKVGSTGCIDCHAGEYSDVEGATSCKACPVGKYSIKTESNSCMGCPAGQYTDTVGSTRCKSCPAGKYSNGVESTMCMTCPAGKYSDKLESTSCMGCPAGQYSETTGSSSCEACPPGKYSNNVASTSCKTCPAGQYNNRAGARSCRVCRAGTYSSAGSTGCRTCPRGMNSRQGSSRCTCPSGYTMSRGSCFKVYGNAKNYDGARRACISDSGRLAMPKSSAVNTFIQGLARKDKRNGDYFIGLSDEQVEGHWRFADNSFLGSYKNWNPREPNNYRGGEDCVVMRYNGRWNDQNCRRAFPYICQIN